MQSARIHTREIISMKRRIVVIAHNIRSLWNVGSFFRTSDAFSVEKLYLTGYTAFPPRREISKTALGAEEWIPWEQRENPLGVISELKSDGWQIVALEQTDKAEDLNGFLGSEKVCLIFGHEVSGVSEELLNAADVHIQIPMHGQKESINVSVAAGIALNHLRNR